LVGVVALFELWSYDRARELFANFRRTTQLVTSGVASLAVVGIAFAAFGILDDFLFFYRTFLRDHALTGGMRVQWSDGFFYFAAFAPPIAVILTIWFFATARRAGWRPRIDDWVVGGLALTVILYYPKFLSRADYPHLLQVLPVAAPLIAYLAYRGLSLLQGRPWSTWVTGAVIAAAALLAPIPILDRAEEIPKRVSVEAPDDPVPPRLGFENPNSVDLEMIRDVDWILDYYLEPDETVFDFSNNPFFFHYLVERRSASRYFHVSMAIRRSTQRDLIAELERRDPRLIVSESALRYGFPVLDGISNQVRHYDVSEYILDNYRPLLESQGFVFWARNGAGLRPPSSSERPLFDPPSTRDLYLEAVPCEWGYAPNFLNTGPTAAEAQRGVGLRGRRVRGAFRVTGWAADFKATAPAERVVAALGRRIYGAAVPVDERLDVAGGLGDPGFARPGFRMVVPAVVPLQQLRFYGLTRDGTARELVYAPQSGLSPVSKAPDYVVFDGRRYAVIPGGIHGWAETATGERATIELTLPAGARPSDFDWLELRTPTRFESDTFGITDTRGEPKRTISFSTLDRGQRVIHVQLAACNQWRALGNRLYLESDTEQDIDVRLIP
jgi:hypothetical protein